MELPARERASRPLLIRGGYNLAFECPAPTPVAFALNIRPERSADLVQPEIFTLYPDVPYSVYIDSFGNKCTRLNAPAGRLSIWNRFIIAWFEIYLGGRWWALDARHNLPRIGRILIARGRDAADVAISTVFGQAILTEFRVITEL